MVESDEVEEMQGSCDSLMVVVESDNAANYRDKKLPRHAWNLSWEGSRC